MTEHDRGAYTPQPDTPLQFDARGPRRRKPMPMTLIGSGAVLVVLLGALALHYKHDSKVASEPARPVGAPVAEIKTAATPPAAPATQAPATQAPVAAKEGGAVDVFGGSGQTASASAPAKAPTFTAPPEAPKSRAQLTVQTEEAAAHAPPLATTTVTHPAAVAPPPLPTTVAKAAPAAPAPVAVAKTPAAPTAVAKAPAYHAPGSTIPAPAPTTVAAKPKPDASALVARLADGPAPKPVSRSAAATASTASTKAAGVFAGSVVQIGAFSSMSQSEKGWTDVSSAMSGQMSGKMKRVEAVEKDGKTFYRTSVTGFASRAAAEAFCRSLTAKGHACFAKG